MMAELDQTDCAIAASIQIGGKPAQDFVRVLILLVNQGGEVALRIKHRISS
jgi:hypothetical protein